MADRVRGRVITAEAELWVITEGIEAVGIGRRRVTNGIAVISAAATMTEIPAFLSSPHSARLLAALVTRAVEQ